MNNTSWSQSESICARKGGHLVSITSQNEQNTVNDVCIVQQFKKLDFFKNDDRFSVPLQWDKCQ